LIDIKGFDIAPKSRRVRGFAGGIHRTIAGLARDTPTMVRRAEKNATSCYNKPL
jgi:hypothetical protein